MPAMPVERFAVCSVFDGGLRTFSGDDNAKMRYTAKAFRDEVVLPYSAKLPGWPPHIPFCNLSRRGGPSLPDIHELISLVQRGILRFEHATPEEIQAARLDVANAVPGPLFPTRLPDVARRDIGSQRPHFDADGELIPPRYARNGPKSAAWIDDEESDSAAAVPAGWGPITMWKDGFRCVLEDGSWSLREAEGTEGEEEEDPVSDWD
ncbi:hypothetical protein GSI_02706 [Ganoderma sinense ZZ0214-1]|uniref:Uncharacterized protein n=1 Tax=Ganoderma sinense ZZ0214-1 TaxID=1077348 RepID=A0A2G8SME8_9APHY|nr:hypothetical protein GSI_02706 [Ganoderma sinense ZZ0214-1]